MCVSVLVSLPSSPLSTRFLSKVSGISKKFIIEVTKSRHGVKNLRVADASIMPHVTTGNVLGSVYMIGRKAATIISETSCS